MKLRKQTYKRLWMLIISVFLVNCLVIFKAQYDLVYNSRKLKKTSFFICINNTFYYPTALRRVQITPKTSTNITRYLYCREPVRQVFLVLLLLTNQLAGFPAPIPFHFAYFCHAFREIRAHGRNNLACWIINLLLDVLLCSIAENFYSLFVF